MQKCSSVSDSLRSLCLRNFGIAVDLKKGRMIAKVEASGPNTASSAIVLEMSCFGVSNNRRELESA